MKKWYLVIDVEKCENCNNCFLSCKDEFVDNEWTGYSAPQPDHGHRWINIQSKERGQFPLIDVAYLPVPCMHCDDAPCVRAARNGAVYKRPDGIVIIDPVKAKGQKNLVNVCPYNAIWWNDKLEMPQKCTLCAHLLDDGWTKPRCVQACPTGALTVLFKEEAEVNRMIEVDGLEIYLPEHQSRPRVYYKNLYRFTGCFVAGSVARRENGREDCVENAKIILNNSGGEKVGECVTDNYGDFKIDGLKENSGKYVLQCLHNGRVAAVIDIDLKTSLNIGVIFLPKD